MSLAFSHWYLLKLLVLLWCLESEHSNSQTLVVAAKCQEIQNALAAEQAMGPLKWSELWENKITANRKHVVP
jgi:hypothetical protein